MSVIKIPITPIPEEPKEPFDNGWTDERQSKLDELYAKLRKASAVSVPQDGVHENEQNNKWRLS